MTASSAAQLGAEIRIGPSQIGTYFFVENGAFSAASLLSLFWLGRLNVRIVGLIALAVFVLGNFITRWYCPITRTCCSCGPSPVSAGAP